MKKSSLGISIALTLGLLGLVAALLAPEEWFMTSQLEMTLMAMFLVAILVFLVLFVNESPSDEREISIVQRASRYSYFLGVLTLIIGLTVQTFSHDIDPFVLIALFAMVSSKIIFQSFLK